MCLCPVRWFVFWAGIVLATCPLSAFSSNTGTDLRKADSLLAAAQKFVSSKPETGIFWLKEAQFIYRNHGMANKEVDCILTLAEINIRISDYDAAYRLLTTGASIALKKELKHQHIMALSSLARVSAYMDEVDRADEFLREGIARADEYGFRKEKLFMSASRCYIRMYYKKEYSLKNFNTIRHIHSILSKPPMDSLMLMPLENSFAGALYLVKRDYEEAGRHYEEALSIARGLGDRWRLALYSNNYGDMLRQIGKLDEAENMFAQSLKDAREINSKLLIYNGYKHLSSCAEDRGDFKKALDLYKTYVQVKAQVLDEDLIRKTRYIYSLYQLERKGRENDLIRMEKLREKQRAESSLRVYQVVTVSIFVLLLVFLLLFYQNRRSLRKNQSQKTIIEHQNAKLQELNKSLWEQRKMADDARVEAEKAIQSKIDFFSIITHEIRTPLNAVIGTAQLLEEEGVLPHQARSLNILKFSADNLLSLVNDILDFNRIEAGKIELESKPFSLSVLLTNIRNSLLMNAEEKGVALNLRIDKKLPETFLGDRLRLGQVFYNLISNALKFTEKGSVEMEIRYYPDKAKDNVKAIVRDTGIGISPDRQKGIFEFFTQADTGIAQKFGGFGLGLTITKNLLALMNSSIEVESKPGKGSEFSFCLTLEVVENPLIAENQELAVPVLASLDGATILFVEDVEFNRVVAERFFRKWKLNFDTADTGARAIELAKENSYDLILMDLQLPDMDGFATTEIIRQLPGHEETIVLAMTASSYFEVKEKFDQYGISGYISKPFVSQDLKNMLNQWLRQRPG